MDMVLGQNFVTRGILNEDNYNVWVLRCGNQKEMWEQVDEQ